MDANKNCYTCKKEITGDDESFMFDAYNNVMHKNCTNLAPSEVKCMPLKKGILMTIGKIPYMIQAMIYRETIRANKPMEMLSAVKTFAEAADTHRNKSRLYL